MKIYRIDHVAQAVPDLEKQVALLETVFGFRATHRWDNEEAGVRGARLEIPGTWGHTWQVLAPAGSSSSIQAWLDDHGGRGGLHHVGVEVPDLDAAVSELDSRGIKLTDGVPGKWVEASLSPPQHGPGVLFRLRGPGTLSMTGEEASIPVPASVPEGPTLGIVNLDHICQAFLDRDELAAWYADLAGFVQVWRTADDEHPDMADLVLNVPGSSICWEVIMPRGEDSFIEKFYSRNGAAAHHVTFQVSSWDAFVDAARFHSLPTFDEESGLTDGAAWKHTFIHPKQTGGILVQVFWEERPGVWVRSDKIPAALMDLTLTEDQTLVQRTAREFLASRSGADVWKEIVALGWPGLGFEDFGFLETCLLIEELGRAGVATPMVTVSCGFAAPSLRADIAAGSVYTYVTSGMASYAADAAGFLVAGPDGVSLVSSASVTPVEVVGLEPKYRVEISSPGDLLPDVTASAVEAFGAAATCAEMVGGAQGVLDRTVEYAKQREQFGKPIGAFQAVQHHCANMAIDVLGARFIAYEAIWRLSKGLDASTEVSVAKSFVSSAYERVCALGHQVHGAIGFTAEHDLHRFTRHATASALNYGDADTHTDRLATQLGI